MFIFDMKEKVDNRAEVMLRQMDFEKGWRLSAAEDMESQAECITKPEHYIVKQTLLDIACKYRREAMEIGDCYYKLKNVLNKLR